MTSEAIEKNPLSSEPIGGLMLKYAIPSVISLVVNSLYNMRRLFEGKEILLSGFRSGNGDSHSFLPDFPAVSAPAYGSVREPGRLVYGIFRDVIPDFSSALFPEWIYHSDGHIFPVYCKTDHFRIDIVEQADHLFDSCSYNLLQLYGTYRGALGRTCCRWAGFSAGIAVYRMGASEAGPGEAIGRG